MSTIHKSSLPKDGLEGLKQNFSTDATSGFIVFLLALPLSLGIAKASDFPPVMGLVTAIIGGIVVSFLAGSKLTIKGPAAGLIVIVAGAVAEFGGGETGWHLALGAMVVAGLMQILLGLLKMGKFADFFPLSAIHGMLAAIGLIIIAKQIPVLLDINPEMTKGKGPFELLGSIPNFIAHLDPKATAIGVVSLAIMMGWPYIKNKFIKKNSGTAGGVAHGYSCRTYHGFSTYRTSLRVGTHWQFNGKHQVECRFFGHCAKWSIHQVCHYVYTGGYAGKFADRKSH